MNKTKTCTRLSALFAVLLAIMIAVPAILQSGADAAVNKKQPTKATLTSAKATSYNKVSLKWKKSKNITSYAVYYKASNSKKWVKIANVSSKKTGYTHKSSKKYPLKQGKTYQYRIRGYNKKAKGSKKWGKYSSIKKVNIPKKPAAKPTETPKPTAKPTEAPKPTVAPKPTTAPKPTAAPKPTVTPIPKPTAIPKPTTIPKPTAIPKPTEAPKPTAVPQPTKAPQPTVTPRPTATLAPTATPKPVKVSSITLNQTSLTMTSKGQTASLTATVSPGNAENKNITWSSSNSSVATVNANGTVTAIANGTADITATAADGSGVSAKCSVTVKVPNNVRNITLEGGKAKNVGPTDTSLPNFSDFSNITFEVLNNNAGAVDILGFSSNMYSASVCVKGLRVGNCVIIAKYNGQIIMTYNVSVISNWNEYLEYTSWRKSIENKIWSSGMSVVNKLDAAKNFIQSHYGYQNGAGAIINVYNGAVLDCYGATELMSDFAKDIELSIKYVNAVSGHIFDYSGYAFSEGGHVYPRILINGNWVNYDATPTHS